MDLVQKSVPRHKQTNLETFKSINIFFGEFHSGKRLHAIHASRPHFASRLRFTSRLRFADVKKRSTRQQLNKANQNRDNKWTLYPFCSTFLFIAFNFALMDVQRNSPLIFVSIEFFVLFVHFSSNS